MKFKMTHKVFKDNQPEYFTEKDAPEWLSSVNTVIGSTMDMRWWFEDVVLMLSVGDSVDTDFRVIERVL